MRYLLMIMNREDEARGATLADMAMVREAHHNFASYLMGRGGEFSGEALHFPSMAKTLRPGRNASESLVTDGPFVDLKEHLGGFYIIEATGMDDAIDVARHCPGPYGIEVRPIFDFPVG